ncbi:PAS domain S-box protein [Virgibacillus massiliensis]|nr:PAS domain S-box protein [Virgibacillus massiliensis]
MEDIHILPLPAVIVDEADRIIEHNIQLASSLEVPLTKGDNFKQLFLKWEEINKLISATRDSKTFVFIECAIDSGKLFIGLESPALASMKEENNKLKSMNREFDAIIENSYDGIYITDHKGITWNTNSAIERITGIPKEYYIGKNVDDLVKRGILKKSVTKKVLELKRTVSYVQRNNAGKEVLLTGAPVFNDRGEIEKIVTNIRDLKDLNELQIELNKLNKLNDQYKEEIRRLMRKSNDADGFITENVEMKRIYDTAERIANIDATVLILGETGVGKDVLATYIYNQSIRSKKGKFLKVNCGAIPPELLESELFGYSPGAFTGANKNGKPGIFEAADKGILFLDEIGELPSALQVKLLRVLQEGELQRIGSSYSRKVDVRIIAATNRDLSKMVKEGSFREDLFYRLHVIPIRIPPLRKRKEDIYPMIQHFLGVVNQKYHLNKEIDYELNDFFLNYSWPGNIRELSNVIERLVVTTRNDLLTIENLPDEYKEIDNLETHSSTTLKQAVELAEQYMIRRAASRYGNTYELAKALGTSQPTIVRKLSKYNINLH